MSIWEDHFIEARIREILATVPIDDHHFGRSFLSPYQIAIEFTERYPEITDQIEKPIGGEDTGQHDSLAQYFANQLSRRINDDPNIGIEGAFLDGRFLTTLEYERADQSVVASLGHQRMSMFRLGE